MAYGVTPEGFKAKPLATILAEIEADQRDLIDEEIDQSPESPVGQLNGIMADHLRQGWELTQDTYTAGTVRTSGVSLAHVAALTRTTRDDATKSRAVLTLTVAAGKTVPAGTRVGSADGSSEFLTDADAVNGTGFDDDLEVNATASIFGAVVANAGTLTVNLTGNPDLLAVINAADAVEGQLREGDVSLRSKQRRERDHSVEAALLKLDGILDARVEENPQAEAVNGIAAHGIEAVVFDGPAPVVDDSLIAQTIWETKGGGTATSGTSSGTATDSEGGTRLVSFSRPTTLDVYLELDLRVNGNAFPVDGKDEIKTALADFGDANLGPGDDLILSQLCQPVFDVSGVLDIVEVRVGLSASPTSTENLITTIRQLADLDTGRIAINLV